MLALCSAALHCCHPLIRSADENQHDGLTSLHRSNILTSDPGISNRSLDVPHHYIRKKTRLPPWIVFRIAPFPRKICHDHATFTAQHTAPHYKTVAQLISSFVSVKPPPSAVAVTRPRHTKQEGSPSFGFVDVSHLGRLPHVPCMFYGWDGGFTGTVFRFSRRKKETAGGFMDRDDGTQQTLMVETA